MTVAPRHSMRRAAGKSRGVRRELIAFVCFLFRAVQWNVCGASATHFPKTLLVPQSNRIKSNQASLISAAPVSIPQCLLRSSLSCGTFLITARHHRNEVFEGHAAGDRRVAA